MRRERGLAFGLVGCASMVASVTLAQRRQDDRVVVAPDRVMARPVDGLDAIGSITPDGLHFVTTDWNTGDLVARELATRQATPLEVKTSGPATSLAARPVLSPDSSQLAYVWFEIDTANGQEKYELRVRGTRDVCVRCGRRRRAYSRRSSPRAAVTSPSS